MLSFLKVFEAERADIRASWLLSALFRMAAFAAIGLLFILTIYALW
ncbi:hypothetical protein [Qipengyuania sphaerica]|nr:hypothetical protein [Qipengyuania sphaerica]MBX7541002.1 hypothetical protein [Qipengyuania sphaerica]